MFTEEGEEEDTLRRGTDDANTEPQVPVVDVFDELLGITTTSASVTTTAATALSTATITRTQPTWSKPSSATPAQHTTVSNSVDHFKCKS